LSYLEKRKKEVERGLSVSFMAGKVKELNPSSP
jgi:hypothetical protein